MTEQQARLVVILREWTTLSRRLSTHSPAEMHSFDHLFAATTEMIHELENSPGPSQEKSQTQPDHAKPAGGSPTRNH